MSLWDKQIVHYLSEGSFKNAKKRLNFPQKDPGLSAIVRQQLVFRRTQELLRTWDSVIEQKEVTHPAPAEPNAKHQESWWSNGSFF